MAAASDHRRLEQLAPAGADQGGVDARFLLSEIVRKWSLIAQPGRTNVVKVERVSRRDPTDVVSVLFGNPEVTGKKVFDDGDPGPSAA
ncbi:hypothetical protein ACVWZ4_005748 [Bradyrhizobium sp. USDA 4472]